MRLKEIKPGMVIHCKSDKEMKALLEEAERLGYFWNESNDKPTEIRLNGIGNTIHFYDKSRYGDHKYITWSYKTEGVTEFSDLILPELTVEEVLRISTEICNASDCDNGCPLAAELDDFTKQCMICPKSLKTYSGTIPIICAKWKSDHEKKEPEIETVGIFRIIEVMPDGRKRCVHEEDVVSELAFGGDECEIVHNILKRYCMEHEGEFIAVREVVSRAKR